MPKLVLTAAGDEFFLPDSPQFFIRGLPGETHLNVCIALLLGDAPKRSGAVKLMTGPQVIPDAEHSLATAYVDVAYTISGFYQMVIAKTKRPTYSYQIIKSNTTASIHVQVDTSTPCVPYLPLSLTKV